jgi:2-phosphosulfolactate phosphatase
VRVEIFDHVAGAREARGIAVVVDVFRAFSVAPYAFDGGAARVLPAGEIEEALELGRRFPGAVLVGERHARRLATRRPRSARSTCAARCWCTPRTPARRGC